MSDILPSTVVTGSTYTFAVTDNGTVVEGNSASAQTFTIPTNATAAFPVGAIFEVYQSGAGQITITAAAGVNLRTPNGSRTAERYATVSLRQRATDEWVLSGDTDGVGTGPPGPTGAAGADGAQGPPGPPGGGTISDVWVWLAPATSALVGATRVGVNHDAPASATECWIHKESKNANIDYSTTISALVAGDHLYLQAKSNASSFHRYTITGVPALQGGTTWKIPVVTDTGSPSGTEPANGSDVLVAFQFQPLQGPAGPTGPTGPTGATGAAGASGTTATDRGVWAASTAYAVGDIVVYGGCHFQRLGTGFTSGALFDPANWLAQDQLGVDNPAGWGAANTHDYEFDGSGTTVPSGWAWVNQGTADYFEQHGTGRIYGPSVGGNSYRIVKRAVTGTAWVATAKWALTSRRAQYPGGGIVLREASSGRLVPFFVSSDTDATWPQTAINVNYLPGPGSGAGAAHLADAKTTSATTVIYLRIRKISSTSYTFEWSADGTTWLALLAAYNPTATLTPDEIGFFVDALNSDTVGACHWFRVR